MRPRSPGWWLQLLGIAHACVGAVLHRKGLADIARGGVIAQVPDQGERATAFWFVVAAPALWAAGRLLRAAEDAGDSRAQRDAGLVVAGVGVAGSVAMPASPFWGVLVVGLAAVRRSRSGAPIRCSAAS